ncbi:MAG: CadC-family transcriptional regulator, partial [Proteobacteria bacterium]|nr:CadC-family transcriptional regulator [Pseudomonadota bacterium]
EAASGNHIWADRYDGALDDIFDLQDEITASVVGAIEPQLLRAEVQRIRQKRPESLDAYDYTLRGLAHMNKLNPDDTAEGLRLFRKAIEVDANYARAYACASWFYRRQVQLRGMVLSDEDRDEGIRLAQAGLKADNTDPYVLWQAGMTVSLVEGDFDAAILYIDRSLSINSNSTRAWLSSASVRCCVGDPETAIEHADRAIRLSPLDVAMWVAHGVLATAHLQLADYEEAAAWARKSVRQHAYNAPAYHVLAACCAHLGRTEEAGAAVARSLELDPAMTISRLKAIYPVSGYRNLDGFLEGLRKAGLAD